MEWRRGERILRGDLQRAAVAVAGAARRVLGRDERDGARQVLERAAVVARRRPDLATPLPRVRDVRVRAERRRQLARRLAATPARDERARAEPSGRDAAVVRKRPDS